MVDARFSRTARLLGEEAIDMLRGAHVMLLGLGGVGGHALDALIRSGVGRITVVDGDAISLSNCNRQILADLTTVGMRKVRVAANHVSRISPETEVTCLDMFITAENAARLLREHPADIVLDAIDTVSAKVALAAAAEELGISYLACMSTGNRMDPSRFRITDISKTHTCPISRVMRRSLAACGVRHLTVLWTDEPTIRPADDPDDGARHVPASSPFVPATAGIRMAQWAVTTLLEKKGTV